MFSPEKASPEDPRVTRTRGLIVQAFMDILPLSGFQAASVQDITRKAGVNRATFYAHFTDKYALLDYVIRRDFRQELASRTLDACHYSEPNLRALVVTVCEFVARIHASCPPGQPQFESLVEAQIKDQLQRILQHWLEEGASASGSKNGTGDTQSAATAASWAIYGLVLQWDHDRSASKPTAEQFAGRVLPLIAVNLKL